MEPLFCRRRSCCSRGTGRAVIDAECEVECPRADEMRLLGALEYVDAGESRTERGSDCRLRLELGLKQLRSKC